ATFAYCAQGYNGRCEDVQDIFMKRYLLFPLAMIVLVTGVVLAAPPQQTANPGAFTNALRADMELMADEVLGTAARPALWVGNLDIRSATMASDLWFDNELLANAVFGDGIRPPTWFGLTSSRADLILRNVRHDLELSASQVFRDAAGATFR